MITEAFKPLRVYFGSFSKVVHVLLIAIYVLRDPGLCKSRIAFCLPCPSSLLSLAGLRQERVRAEVRAEAAGRQDHRPVLLKHLPGELVPSAGVPHSEGQSKFRPRGHLDTQLADDQSVGQASIKCFWWRFIFNGFPKHAPVHQCALQEPNDPYP